MPLLLLALLVGGSARAGEADVHAAVELLSRYPVGQVPVEPGTILAIGTLGAEGSRMEVGVLRSLVEHERDEVRSAAIDAIDAVRTRQRADQRAAYARGLPTERDLAAASVVWERVGLAKTPAHMAAYASFVLGDSVSVRPTALEGDPHRYLATGQPRKALAVLAREAGSDTDLALLAKAREDAADVRGALQAYTLLALSGNAEAEVAITAHGVDAEQLFLGLLVMERAGPVGDEEARLLEALVRHGGVPSVEVLADRMFTAGGSERASAADALIRMLQRPDLSDQARARARTALVRAVEEGPPPVRDIAASGL